MDTKSKIAKIINTILEESGMEVNDNIDSMIAKLNSISYIKLIVELENEFDIEFDDDALSNNYFTGIDTICKYVDEKTVA